MKKLVSFNLSVFMKLVLILALPIMFLACEKSNDCETAQSGVLKNLTGLDGCGWIIQLSDSTKLEPVNLHKFNIELKQNRSVCVRYHERTDLGSYCMVGKVVEIDFIE